MKINWVVKTNQGAFNRVVRHLSKMPKRAALVYQIGCICVYETKDGCQCAAGCLIRTKKERLNLNPTGRVKPDWFEDTRLSYVLIGTLQSIHDDLDNWDRWGFIGYKNLAQVSVDFGLSNKVLADICQKKGIKL